MDQSTRARPAALLEREQEVERVRATLRAAGQRSGAALIVEGAAGMGKSRLLEEAHAQASDLGCRVLAARGTELEQGFPFGVVRQLFERPLLEADAGEREHWLAGAAALAAEVLTAAPAYSAARSQVHPSAIRATRGNTACTGSLPTSPPMRRSYSRSTISNGATHRRRARSHSSLGGSRDNHSRSSSPPGRSIPR